MRLTWRDLAATLAVAGAVTLYACFLADVNPPLVSGPRVLAGAVLVLGMAACALGGSSTMVADRAQARAGRITPSGASGTSGLGASSPSSPWGWT